MNSNEELIQFLIKEGYLKTPAIIGVFKSVDRKIFVPSEWKEKAYVNQALPIMKEQTISQPLVVAFMLELLDLKSGEKVLEIGSGSGWKTALMSQLVGENGKIVSLERIKDLHKFSRENLQAGGFLGKDNIRLILGDGSKGFKEEAPYDKIIASAAAETLPKAWKEQLKIGGKIVAPVQESILALEKLAKDKFETKEYLGFRFVPLIRD